MFQPRVRQAKCCLDLVVTGKRKSAHAALVWHCLSLESILLNTRELRKVGWEALIL